jgi:hypothetical protein
VLEWRVQWLVRIRRAVPGSWPKTELLERVVGSPAELRALIAACRADPAVLAFPYEQRRELVGEPPTECRRGHLYQRPGSPYPDWDQGWAACCCGGHRIYICKVSHEGQQCGDARMEPSPSFDCDVRRLSAI